VDVDHLATIKRGK